MAEYECRRKESSEFFDAGYLLYDYATYDAFNEEAREMYWKQAQEGGCLTRALIPGGVTPQSRFPVRTGAVR